VSPAKGETSLAPTVVATPFTNILFFADRTARGMILLMRVEGYSRAAFQKGLSYLHRAARRLFIRHHLLHHSLIPLGTHGEQRREAAARI